jgi:hypothetical protein
MALISVKTVAGRKAFTDPTNAKEIPSDRFIRVARNAHIDRLIAVHGDLIVQPEEPAQTAAPEPVDAPAETPAKANSVTLAKIGG